nr:YihY/virulence factor BrkB family protein [Variovorax sp. dw_954]
MGAAISYYTIFSLAPLLVIVIAVAGAIFGRDAAQDQIVAQIGGLVGQDGATAVEAMLRAASDTDKGLVAGIISFVVLLVGATTVFAELQSALDRIWHVPEKEKPTGVWAVLRARVLSFGLILGVAFLLIVSLMVSAGLAAFDTWFGGLMPGWEALMQTLNLLISFGIVTLLFAMIFKLMPTAKIAWRDVWIGAGVTALLFELGKLGIGSACTWARAASPSLSRPPDRWWCWSPGSTTLRRSSCSVRSSPRSMPMPMARSPERKPWTRPRSRPMSRLPAHRGPSLRTQRDREQFWPLPRTCPTTPRLRVSQRPSARWTPAWPSARAC